MKHISALLFFLALICGRMVVAHAGGEAFHGFPMVPPTGLASLKLSDSCPDRPAASALLSEIAASDGSKDSVFHVHREPGKVFLAFRPTKRYSLSLVARCFDTYLGTIAQAKKAGLWVPDGRFPIGTLVFTPSLGFYADPRAWKAAK